MVKKSPIHYYKDGDILLVVGDTSFCVHRLLLSLTSKVFKDMFNLAKPNEHQGIPQVELTGETTEDIESLLTHIYPGSFFEFTASNVHSMLRLGDKYMIDSIPKAADLYLSTYYPENPLKAFYLADKYNMPITYKESSKLVLDKLHEYYTNKEDFAKLSEKSRRKLFERCWRCVEYIRKLDLNKLTVDQHTCSMTSTHLTAANAELKKRIADVLVAQNQQISSIPRILLSKFCFADQKTKGCNVLELAVYADLLKTGKFEELELTKNLTLNDLYLFIELEK